MNIFIYIYIYLVVYLYLHKWSRRYSRLHVLSAPENITRCSPRWAAVKRIVGTTSYRTTPVKSSIPKLLLLSEFCGHQTTVLWPLLNFVMDQKLRKREGHA